MGHTAAGLARRVRHEVRFGSLSTPCRPHRIRYNRSDMGAALSGSLDTAGPVAIGGVGGSGTRVFAAMVSSLGYQSGADLNGPEDDLTFSVLFKRPSLYRDARGLIPVDHPSAVAATKAFVSLRSGHRGLNPEILPIFPACAAFPFSGVYPSPPKRLLWSLHRLQKAFTHTEPPEPNLWTWKEPNTLLFIPTLFQQIPGLRYIHVVRNGLSMAKSRNNFQLRNWGFLFDTRLDEVRPELQQLVYWARVNLAVSDFLATQDRSLVLTHERIVMEPMSVLEEISAFLGRPCTDASRKIAEQVRRPDDFERKFELGVGDLTDTERDDLEKALDRFGYRSNAD